ncbi:hypothetical protein Tco_0158080 [Tanacetum coccineum]
MHSKDTMYSHTVIHRIKVLTKISIKHKYSDEYVVFTFQQIRCIGALMKNWPQRIEGIHRIHTIGAIRRIESIESSMGFSVSAILTSSQKIVTPSLEYFDGVTEILKPSPRTDEGGSVKFRYTDQIVMEEDDDYSGFNDKEDDD